MPGKFDRFVKNNPRCATCGHVKRDHAKWNLLGWFIGVSSCNYDDGCLAFTA